MIALHNLPAEVIDKIQIFDKMSDQSEFTGFDDGQSTKTMNLVLRQDRRNAGFGKVYAVANGTQAIKAAMAPFMADPNFSLTFTSSRMEASKGGDMVYSQGTSGCPQI